MTLNELIDDLTRARGAYGVQSDLEIRVRVDMTRERSSLFDKDQRRYEDRKLVAVDINGSYVVLGC